MSKVLAAKLENDITFVLDYLVEKDEYSPWKEKLTDQLLKNVEVTGFRKGKAPRNLALQQVNQNLLLETVFKESIEKFGTQAMSEVQKELQEKDRFMQNLEVSLDSQYTKEEDGAFQFRLIASLLPDIDLEHIKKIKVEADLLAISGRPSQPNFVAQEKNRLLSSYNEFSDSPKPAEKGDQVLVDLSGSIGGKPEPKLTGNESTVVIGNADYLPDVENGLVGIVAGQSKDFEVNFPDNYFEPTLKGKKAIFTGVCKQVRKPKYKTLEELFENVSEVRDQFKTVGGFEDFLDKFYADETDRLLEEQRQKLIIQKVVEVTPDFTMPETRVESEANRIFGALKKDSETRQLDINFVFSQSGIPGSESTKIKDELQIKQLVEDYVRKEFKLSAILNYIYEKLVTPKITNQQLDQAAKEIAKEPQRYGLDQSASENEIREVTADRLRRQFAAKHVFEVLVPSANPTSDLKEEKAAKSPKKTKDKF
jgi:trigger factor